MLTSVSSPVSLKQRVLGAGFWTVGGYATNLVLRFGSNLAITRLLAPDMFGVMAIAYVIMGGLAMFSDFGIRPLIIRSERGSDPAFLNTAWTIRNIQGVLLWLLAVGSAALIALANRFGMIPHDSVYADPRIPYVIAVVSFISVINGFSSTKLHEASRNLNLRPLTLIGLAGQVVTILFMLSWAAIDRSIWALVAGAICGSLINTILSHSYLPGVPNRWHWDKAAIQEIVQFGKWIVIASGLGFLANNGDRLLLGGLVDPAILGIYALAFFIYKSLDDIISNVIMNVTLPALSEIVREKPQLVKSTLYRLHAVISLFAYFSAGVLMISGQALIAFLYDPRYHQAGWILQILAIALLSTPFGVAERCFIAMGQPKYISQLSAVSMCALALGTIGGFYLYGMAGAVLGIALSYLSSVPLVIFYQIKHGILDIRKELYALIGLPAGMVTGLVLNAIIAHL